MKESISLEALIHDIYKERKSLGRKLVNQILESINNDLDNSVFSFIPNTAEVSFYGLVEGLHDHVNNLKKDKILKLGNDITEEKLNKFFLLNPE